MTDSNETNDYVPVAQRIQEKYPNVVVSKTVNNAYKVVRHTGGSDETLKGAYLEFQRAENKLVWLVENKARLKKYEIDFDELIVRHTA